MTSDREDVKLNVAPCGLGDLLGMVHRRNPARVTVEEYEGWLAKLSSAPQRGCMASIPSRREDALKIPSPTGTAR